MKIALITILVYTRVLIGVLAIIPAPDEARYYDCSMAEFNPDYPKEVREECRKIRNNSKTLVTI